MPPSRTRSKISPALIKGPSVDPEAGVSVIVIGPETGHCFEYTTTPSGITFNSRINNTSFMLMLKTLETPEDVSLSSAKYKAM